MLKEHRMESEANLKSSFNSAHFMAAQLNDLGFVMIFLSLSNCICKIQLLILKFNLVCFEGLMDRSMRHIARAQH